LIVGDRVRIVLQSKDMKEDSKSYTKNSTEVYRITERKVNKFKLNAFENWWKYTRLIKTKDPVTKNPTGDLTPKRLRKVEAPHLSKEEKETKYRKQSSAKGKRGDKALVEYNKTWANSKGFEMSEMTTGRTTRSKGK
jgi:MarR-like DNA-binding transcriptional regulator SgrR of sgrS sRNA